jgi:Leucine-rich repeat (LRR) protein
MGNELSNEFNSKKKLAEVDFSKRNLKTIPPEIKNLKHAVKIDFSHNEISDIPPEISKFKQIMKFLYIFITGKLIGLKSLNLTHNVFYHFPPDLCKMPNLTHVFMGQNRLFYSPITPLIGEMTNLVRLDISHNQLE